METEIDLRPLVTAILRRGRLIVICILIATLIAVIGAMLQSEAYTARADILILASRSRLAFDDRFVTDDTETTVNSNTRRQSLVALASSVALEDEVLDLLPAEMLTEDMGSGSLAGRIQVMPTGDLIQIQASGATEAAALTLADAWGQVYVDTINRLYSSNTAFIEGLEQQIQTSRQDYDQAQQELEAFLRTSQQFALSQRIDILEGLLAESNTANQSLYNQYMARTHELELILQDAQTLRQQSTVEEPESFGNSLAMLALRARAIGEVNLPVQLQLENTDSLTNNNALSMADLDRLIAVLEQRRDELVASSQELAQSIASGQGSAATLPSGSRAQYEEELVVLKQQYEQQNAQELLLTQNRDLALESLAILQRKYNEQRVAQGTPELTVRFVDTVIEPPGSRLTTTVVYVAVAGVLGAGVGMLIALYLELIHPRLLAWRGGGTDRLVDRTLPGQDAA